MEMDDGDGDGVRCRKKYQVYLILILLYFPAVNIQASRVEHETMTAYSSSSSYSSVKLTQASSSWHEDIRWL